MGLRGREPNPLLQVVENGGVVGVLNGRNPALRSRSAGLGSSSGDCARPGEGVMLPGPTLG